MTSILTLDGTVPRSEESSLVFGTEYSHCRCSLKRWVTIQAVLCSKHESLEIAKKPATPGKRWGVGKKSNRREIQSASSGLKHPAGSYAHRLMPANAEHKPRGASLYSRPSNESP